MAWTDRQDKNGIHVGLLQTGEKVRGVIHPGIGTASDVVTYDYSVQPVQSSTCLFFSSEQELNLSVKTVPSLPSLLASSVLRQDTSIRSAIGVYNA